MNFFGNFWVGSLWDKKNRLDFFWVKSGFSDQLSISVTMRSTIRALIQWRPSGYVIRTLYYSGKNQYGKSKYAWDNHWHQHAWSAALAEICTLWVLSNVQVWNVAKTVSWNWYFCVQTNVTNNTVNQDSRKYYEIYHLFVQCICTHSISRCMAWRGHRAAARRWHARHHYHRVYQKKQHYCSNGWP